MTQSWSSLFFRLDPIDANATTVLSLRRRMSFKKGSYVLAVFILASALPQLFLTDQLENDQRPQGQGPWISRDGVMHSYALVCILLQVNRVGSQVFFNGSKGIALQEPGANLDIYIDIL